MYTLFLYIVKNICNCVHVKYKCIHRAKHYILDFILILPIRCSFRSVLPYSNTVRVEFPTFSSMQLAHFKRLFKRIVIFFTWNIKIIFFWAQWIFFSVKIWKTLQTWKIPSYLVLLASVFIVGTELHVLFPGPWID